MDIQYLDLDNFEKIPHQSRLIISAPTGGGKTWKVTEMLEESIVEPPPEQIIYVYAQKQPLYDKLPPGTIFLQGIPENLDEYLSPNIRTLLILDDMQTELENNKEITKLICVRSHHQSTTVWILVQNLFLKGREWRNISLNCDLYMLFANPRDVNQIGILGAQLGNRKLIISAYKDAIQKHGNRGYLFVDLRAKCPDDFRLRTNLLKREGYTIVYRKA